MYTCIDLKPQSLGLHGAADEKDEMTVLPHSLRDRPAIPRRRGVEPHATTPDARASIIAQHKDITGHIRLCISNYYIHVSRVLTRMPSS